MAMRTLLYFLPAILPFALYFAYYIRKGRHLGRNEILVGIKEGPWVRTAILTLFILVVTILFLALLQDGNSGKNYVPTTYKDGKLTQGHTD
ncbi:MAG: hypothetical protein COV36_04065 [Alphaproteobacteria bacterium CG11_big_fil_rev_8_21_14_0_20_44_7]|nr:MAG: hypothetical protein COV36_04065 [Alphaproteobacteria bacterium CG11_big_fil_rev_8_21_14_0_20_44_7]